MPVPRFIIGLIACLWFCVPSAHAASSAELFRRVWEDFESNYSYFTVKGINWSNVYEARKPIFEQNLSPEQFAVELNETLLLLHDWHVAVQQPSGVWIGYQRPYPRNHPAGLLPSYTIAPYQNFLSAGALYHAPLSNNIAHIIIPTLDTATLNKLSDSDLLAFFQQYTNSRGLILDLRRNSGGNELHARRIASFFLEGPTLYGYIRTREGPAPNHFSDLTPKLVAANSSLHIANPIVVLVGQTCLSSAEWFTLMLREAPNAILMGDQTRGGSGNPILRNIPELNINYLMSRWIAYTPEQVVFEDRGIAPAINLDPASSFDDAAQRDYLLEHAIAYLNWRHDLGDPQRPSNHRTDFDADQSPDPAEFLFGTNPTQPASLLKLSITLAKPEISITWPAIPGRRYILQSLTNNTWNEIKTAAVNAAIPLQHSLTPFGPDETFRLKVQLHAP